MELFAIILNKNLGPHRKAGTGGGGESLPTHSRLRISTKRIVPRRPETVNQIFATIFPDLTNQSHIEKSVSGVNPCDFHFVFELFDRVFGYHHEVIGFSIVFLSF